MDTRKTVLLTIRRGAFLLLLFGFALWPQLSRGRSSRMPVAQAGRGFRTATQQPPWSRDVSAVAVNEDGEVFVAAGGACGTATGAGVFRSSNAGESWSALGAGLNNTSVRALAIAESGEIFAGTHDGVFRSTDNGDTWSPSLRDVDISTLVSGPGVLFAGDGCLCSGVYRSRDGGASWEKVNQGLATCVKSLAMDSAGAVFVATAADGVYRSQDKGDSWAPASTGLTALALKTIAVNNEGDVFVGSASDGVFRTEDRGRTWSRAGLKGVGVNTLVIGVDDEMFAGTDTAVYRSTDEGGKWEAVELGFADQAGIGALAFDPTGIVFAASGRNLLRTVSARVSHDSGVAPRAVLVAAPVLDSISSGTGIAVSTLTWSHTISAGANRILIVGTSNTLATDSSKTITGVTYGGAPLTRAGFQANGTKVRAEIWFLMNPAIGTANVVVTLPSATDLTGGSLGFTGVDPQTGLGTFASASGSTTAPTVAVAAIGNSSIVVDTLGAVGTTGTATAGAGQTARWNLSTGATTADVRGGGSTELATASSVTMSWTLGTAHEWAIGAISVNGVGACCAACVLGYPAPEAGFPRSNTIFLENQVLRGVQGPPQCATGQLSNVIAWYNDEHAITLGVRQVTVINSKVCVGGTSPGAPCTSNAQCGKNGICTGVGTTTTYPVSVLGATPPSHATTTNPLPPGTIALHTGTNDLSGEQAGIDTNECGDPLGCGRPMWPALFVTDITNDLTSRAGDWQHYGIANNPNDVFGTWKSAVRTVDNTVSPPLVSVAPDADPAKNNWNLGPDADAVPAGLVNEGYGAEVRWKLTELVDNNGLALQPNRKYRLQVIVHDGDQNKSGGDVGQGCATAIFEEQCFTAETPTPTPTPNPLTPTITPTFTVTPTPTPSGGADVLATKASAPTSICINGVTADVNVSCSSPPACSGTLTNLTYTINVTNNGPNKATSVTLTDPLPAFTKFVSCRIAPDTACPNPGVAVGSNGTVNVSLGDMTPGNNQIIRIVATVDGDGILLWNDNHPPNQQITQLSNTATVSATSQDPNGNNNAPTVNTSVNYCNPPGVRYRPER